MLLGTLILAGCGETMTNREIDEAMEAAKSAARSEQLAGEVVEISTSFTLGQAAEDAAEELRAWYQSQLPCSTVTREGASLTVDFGTLDDACVYAGHTYAGVATIAITRIDGESVEVVHGWEGLTNGEVTLDGGATVTWSATDGGSRHVVHDVTWTDLATGETADGSGDRTQVLLDVQAGISGGIQVDGTRDWTTERGDWHLDIGAVEMRPQDPVPQAGAYTLTSPAGKQAELAFERVDEDTIDVTFTTGWRTKTFEVTGG